MRGETESQEFRIEDEGSAYECVAVIQRADDLSIESANVEVRKNGAELGKIRVYSDGPCEAEPPTRELDAVANLVRDHLISPQGPALRTSGIRAAFVDAVRRKATEEQIRGDNVERRADDFAAWACEAMGAMEPSLALSEAAFFATFDTGDRVVIKGGTGRAKLRLGDDIMLDEFRALATLRAGVTAMPGIFDFKKTNGVVSYAKAVEYFRKWRIPI